MLVAKVLRLRKLERKFPELFHSTAAKLFNIQCVIHGQCNEGAATFYVANHATYLDVFVLGGVIEGSFVAKSEVSGWPVFGQLARLQNTVFLERRAQRAAEQVAVLRDHLAEGRSLIVFPEGTSTAGDYVAPFRSSLYRAAEGHVIQPVSVVYSDYDGKPMSPAQRDRYAWYLPDPKKAVPNAPFLNHFLAALGLKPCSVHVVFHDPFTMSVGADRKTTASQCEELVRRGLETYLVLPESNGNA
ncbi:MAG: 1-acyl-sn-glycerol-3-phosphate acyltransferase [Pseudomonadales bacterium]|nr:1-acyl-sn-glycerol-3-phosphate acyltransferase [Pseudomonadales bacterium]